MAAKITTTHADLRRSEILLLPPADITADPAKNSRRDPHDAEAVASIAESFRRDGQMQPVLIRKRHDGTAELVAGFRRHAAATLIAASDANFRLRCTLVNCNA